MKDIAVKIRRSFWPTRYSHRCNNDRNKC